VGRSSNAVACAVVRSTPSETVFAIAALCACVRTPPPPRISAAAQSPAAEARAPDLPAAQLPAAQASTAAPADVPSATPNDVPPVASAPPVLTGSLDPSWLPVSDGITLRRARFRVEAESFDELTWVVVRVDASRVRPTILRAPNNRIGDAVADRRIVFAVDGGYFNEGFGPTGLLVARGTSHGAVSARGGSGILVFRTGHAEVVDSTAPFAAEPAPDLAVQCGPRLVERDGTPGVYRDDGQRFARTVACIRDGGRTVDFIATWATSVPMRGPGLFRVSRLLAAPSAVGDPRGCDAALNLDGGPSTAIFARAAVPFVHAGVGPTPWLIVAYVGSASPMAERPGSR